MTVRNANWLPPTARARQRAMSLTANAYKRYCNKFVLCSFARAFAEPVAFGAFVAVRAPLRRPWRLGRLCLPRTVTTRDMVQTVVAKNGMKVAFNVSFTCSELHMHYRGQSSSTSN
jgi:hypothetical protein